MTKQRNPKPDFTQVAFRIVQQATHQAPEPVAEQLSPKAAAGRLGGKKGGKARAKKMTRAERSASAQKAALARWGRRAP